jgi:hypothetical protein
MLLRLRQACDHPHLVKGHESSWTSSLEAAKKLPMERQQELLVCLQSCSALCALCNVSEFGSFCPASVVKTLVCFSLNLHHVSSIFHFATITLRSMVYLI